MKKIDTSDWRKFIIGNLFEPLETGFIGVGKKIGTATTAPDSIHVVPLTAAKNDNNGIMYWGRLGDYVTYSNVIAVIRDGAVSTGRIFAQEQETGTYSHSYFIRVKEREVSFPTNLFLSRILETVIYPRYTRDDACIWERIKYDEILLPVDSDGNPDWMYMDEYMQKILNEADINIENLKKVKEKQSVVGIKEWKDFVFGEVFEIQPQKEVSPIYALNNSQKSDVLYPFLGQSSENNCIISYIYLDDDVLLNNKEKDIAIIIHSNNHLSFCIDEPFYLKDGHGATSIFKNNNLNIYNVRFIIAVLNKTMENLFNYDVKATKDSLKTMIVKLPATSTGEPDWNYMEQCMKKEMNISEKIIGNFELLNIC